MCQWRISEKSVWCVNCCCWMCWYCNFLGIGQGKKHHRNQILKILPDERNLKQAMTIMKRIYEDRHRMYMMTVSSRYADHNGKMMTVSFETYYPQLFISGWISNSIPHHIISMNDIGTTWHQPFRLHFRHWQYRNESHSFHTFGKRLKRI